MYKLAKTLIALIVFAFGLATTTPFYIPTASAQSQVIKVCSHNGTQNYNILGNNATSLREKLDSPTNFGPNGAYGDYDFQHIDVGDSFTKQTILDNQCDIWFSGFEEDSTYTEGELSELQSWVAETNGQVVAGCDDSSHDPVCELLNFSVTTDSDSYGFLTDTAAENPLNCNGALGPNSRLEMSGGAGGYFSGTGVTAENVLAVHETNGVADNSKPIVVYTGNFFLTSDINMIQAGTTGDGTLSDGPSVTTPNDILAMNAFSALADASVGKEICTSVEPAPTPSPVPSPTPTTVSQIVCASCGDVHILTPDGLRYDFQETGDYILSQADSGAVMVQARQEAPADNLKVSVNTATAMLVAGDKLEFYGKPERAFYINDELTEFPTSELTLPQGGRVTLTYGPSAQDYTIFWPDGNTGARVIVLSNGHLDIGIARLGGTLTFEGVLGNLDRNSQNDIQVRGGDQFAPPATLDQLKTFGDSWRVPVGESLFAEPLPADTVEASGDTLTLLDIDPADRAEAAQTCKEAGVSNQVALENCTYDVAATGDPAFVESALTFEEAVEQQPEPPRYELAVPAQTLAVGQQYAVPDVPGTFRYFQLTQLPAQSGDPATLELCPERQSVGTVFINDIMTDEAALLQGLTATNEPCSAPTDKTGAEIATTTEPAQEATATTEPVAEATAEPVAEATVEPVEEATAEPVIEATAEPAASGESGESGAGNAGGNFCNGLGVVMMPLLLGMVFATTNRRRRR